MIVMVSLHQVVINMGRGDAVALLADIEQMFQHREALSKSVGIPPGASIATLVELRAELHQQLLAAPAPRVQTFDPPPTLVATGPEMKRLRRLVVMLCDYLEAAPSHNTPVGWASDVATEAREMLDAIGVPREGGES